MNNQYAQIMTDFFKNIDRTVEKKPINLAKEYFEYFLNNDIHRMIQKTQSQNTTVASLSRNSSLSFYTKRVSLVADTTILTHKNEDITSYVTKSDSIDYYIPNGSYHKKIRDQLIKTEYGMTSVDVAYNFYGICNDYTELGRWLKECKSLLTSGKLFYYPNILSEGFYEDDGEDDWTYSSDSFQSETTLNIIDKYNNFADILTTDIRATQLIRPIVKVEIPYIENINLENFCKITTEESEPFENFKAYLRIAFQELKNNEGSESFDANLDKIGQDIKKDLRSLNADFAKLRSKGIFNAIKASITTTSAVLVAVHCSAFNELLQIIGTSSGLGLIYMINLLQEYMDLRRETVSSDNYYNYYYLWLISKKAKHDK